MSWSSLKERRAQLSWAKKKRQSLLQLRVNRLLRELRDRMGRGDRQPGDVDRYQHAAGECVDGRWAYALGVLTSSSPPQPRGALSRGRGKLIKFPGAE